MTGRRRATKDPQAPSEGGSRVFSFRLPNDLADEWDGKIRRSGMDKSKFFRTAVVLNETTVIGEASPKKKRAVRTANNVHPEIRRANFLLAQASNNLNQVAHRLNADHKAGLVTPALYAEIVTELHNISAIVKERF